MTPQTIVEQVYAFQDKVSGKRDGWDHSHSELQLCMPRLNCPLLSVAGFSQQNLSIALGRCELGCHIHGTCNPVRLLPYIRVLVTVVEQR